MIVNSFDGHVATVQITVEEAKVFHAGLTAAKLAIGNGFLAGVDGVDVEYLRSTLDCITKMVPNVWR